MWDKGTKTTNSNKTFNNYNLQITKNQIITITFFLNNYIIKTQWCQITTICKDPGKKHQKQLHSPTTLSNYIPLLHNKNTNKQTQTQEKTNPIPKKFPFTCVSILLGCVRSMKQSKLLTSIGLL